MCAPPRRVAGPLCILIFAFLTLYTSQLLADVSGPLMRRFSPVALLARDWNHAWLMHAVVLRSGDGVLRVPSPYAGVHCGWQTQPHIHRRVVRLPGCHPLVTAPPGCSSPAPGYTLCNLLNR
jgi:hypothetical protein